MGGGKGRREEKRRAGFDVYTIGTTMHKIGGRRWTGSRRWLTTSQRREYVYLSLLSPSILFYPPHFPLFLRSPSFSSAPKERRFSCKICILWGYIQCPKVLLRPSHYLPSPPLLLFFIPHSNTTKQELQFVGDEWSDLSSLQQVLDEFLFPFLLPASSCVVGEVGSGGGRVAAQVAPKVKNLYCFGM